MMKRVLCLAMAMVLAIGILAQGVPVTYAASRSASEKVISLIKTFEGFHPAAYWDVSQYSIGYGTSAEKGQTITEEAANTALRKQLKAIDTKINEFASKNKIAFSQQQHDALVSLSYNCGLQWTSSDGHLRSAILNGAAEEEFLFAISLWANVGTVPDVGLIKRRLCEANLYLNGVYSANIPNDYSYVIFDANGGTPGHDGEDEMQGYRVAGAAILTAEPSGNSGAFLGWFTEASGGKQVTKLDSSTKATRLYAHYDGADEDTVQGANSSSETKVIASGTVICDTTLNVRKAAGTGNAITALLTNGAKVSFTEFKTVDGIRWGKVSNGWICMTYVNLDSDQKSTEEDKTTESAAEQDKDSRFTSYTGTVNSTTKLNVREAAGMIGKIVDSLSPGTSVTILDEAAVSGVSWGRIGVNRWVCLQYISKGSTGTSKTETSETDTEKTEATDSKANEAKASGVVVCQGYLNVRNGAGIGNASVGSLSSGTKVTIYETSTVNSAEWGRIGKDRWVCLNYVLLDSEKTVGQEAAGQKGTVNTTLLNVRSNAGVTSTKVGTLTSGTQVTVLEEKTVSGVKWGRIGTNRWVCMIYVKLASGNGS